MSGVATSLPELVRLRHSARSLEQERARRIVAPLAGPYRSTFRGRGVELDEVRAYQPGDDARGIDWRVTARTGRMHTRVFHEERERPVWLFVDVGPSMRFGTRRAFKSVVAARAAALLGWSAHLAGDRVGGMICASDALHELDPGAGEKHWLSVLDAIARGTRTQRSTPPPPFSAALERLESRVRAGSRVHLVSDFYGYDDRARARIAELARRCDLACVLVYDVVEALAPPPGRYAVSDGVSVREVSPDAGSPGTGWGAAFVRRQIALRELCQRHRVPLVALRTDQELLPALSGTLRAGSGTAAVGTPS